MRSAVFALVLLFCSSAQAAWIHSGDATPAQPPTSGSWLKVTFSYLTDAKPSRLEGHVRRTTTGEEFPLFGPPEASAVADSTNGNAFYISSAVEFAYLRFVYYGPDDVPDELKHTDFGPWITPSQSPTSYPRHLAFGEYKPAPGPEPVSDGFGTIYAESNGVPRRFNTVPLPEPATGSLLLVGALGVMRRRR